MHLRTPDADVYISFVITNTVLRPEAIDYILQEFEQKLAASFSDLTNKIGRMRQRAEQIRQELTNLIATAASCGHSPTLVEAISSREQELERIPGNSLAQLRTLSPLRSDKFGSL